MSLVTPESNQPRTATSMTCGGFRQVLAVVDLDAPVEPAVRRAAATSAAHAVPLQVVVLYRRSGFSTDPVLVFRMARRLHLEQRRAVAAVRNAAKTAGLSAFDLRLVPVCRFPLGDGLGQIRRTVMAQLRQQPSSLLVSAEHLMV